MEKIIDIFEKKVGKSIRELTEEDIIDILKNEGYRDFFKNPDNALIILGAISKMNTYETVRKEAALVSYNIMLIRAEALVDSAFNSYSDDEIDANELKEKIKNFILDKDDRLLSLVAVACSLLSLGEMDVSAYLDNIDGDIAYVKEILDTIWDLDSSYPMKVSLFEFLFQIREDYFIRYNTDILKDIEWINLRLKELHEYEDEFLRKDLPKEVPVEPEELGHIDITKLNKRKGGE